MKKQLIFILFLDYIFSILQSEYQACIDAIDTSSLDLSQCDYSEQILTNACDSIEKNPVQNPDEEWNEHFTQLFQNCHDHIFTWGKTQCSSQEIVQYYNSLSTCGGHDQPQQVQGYTCSSEDTSEENYQTNNTMNTCFKSIIKEMKNGEISSYDNCEYYYQKAFEQEKQQASQKGDLDAKVAEGSPPLYYFKNCIKVEQQWGSSCQYKEWDKEQYDMEKLCYEEKTAYFTKYCNHFAIYTNQLMSHCIKPYQFIEPPPVEVVISSAIKLKIQVCLIILLSFLF